MKTLKSITEREFRISANKSRRTYTIRTFGSKYRTYRMTKEEFQSCDNYTGNDWNNFLKSESYYTVK